MFAAFFIFAVQWQNVTVALGDSMLEYQVYLTMSPSEFKSVYADTVLIARYEIQLLIYDRKGRQLAGDFWERATVIDSTEIGDTVALVVTKNAARYNLKIIDRYGGIVLDVTDKIAVARFLSNIRWSVQSDTLDITFVVTNPTGESDSLAIDFNGAVVAVKKLDRGTYEDSLQLYTGNLPVAAYPVGFSFFHNNKKVDGISVPVKIERPFYLDEKMWALRISQLIYIAKPGEIDRLKKSEKAARDSMWVDFWKQYDPTPNTAINEREAEYFERIKYCEEQFAFGDKGWRSDRARIYVKYGMPDETVSKPYELSTKPYEVWYYYRSNLKFIFYDRFGFGEYILVSEAGERI